jgi:D-glycero-alpha-D-manno-heptose-7-phosphate kinase
MRVVRSPLRISLCGGGTDLPSYYEKDGYGAVCSLAINKYVYVVAKELPAVFPYRYKLAYSTVEQCQTVDEIKHGILREVCRKYDMRSLDFASFADVPAGTGLGSSSAFTAALLHYVHNQTGRRLAEEACEIEIQRLKEPIGKQDQYASAIGGANYFVFRNDGKVSVNPIAIRDYTMSCLGIFYLGGTRDASRILERQAPDTSVLREMRLQAIKCADSLGEGNMKRVGQFVSAGWELKRSLPGVTNGIVNQAIHEALLCGAYGAKLLGAGATGFLLVVAEPEVLDEVATVTKLPRVPIKLDTVGTVSQ